MQQDHIFDTKIEYLKGVGPRRGEKLRLELGISNLGDLLMHFPFRYIDRSKIHKIASIDADSGYVQLRGRILQAETVGQKRGRRLSALFSDGSGVIDLVWFQGISWVTDKIKPHQEYIVFGKPSLFNGRLNIAHPELETAETTLSMKGIRWQPVYNSTEKLKLLGLDSRGLMKLCTSLMPMIKGQVEETLPFYIIEKLSLPDREKALFNIHFPQDEDMLQKAQARLKFEELLFLQLKILSLKSKRNNLIRGFVFSQVGEMFNSFYSKHLPFPLTNAQKKVIREMRTDMGSGRQMNRLLQGDVGSGKTIVALLLMLLAIDNGYQASLMAPTEILAQQHHRTISRMLEGLPVRVELLTGSSKQAHRQAIQKGLEEGSIHILIGTHALIEDSVSFSKIGLTVIDEQHRFGVEQRARMWEKSSRPPHVLVMTATPIPRTLAMTVYGDLDVSVIDELPPGRKPVKTSIMRDSQRLRLHGFLKSEIDAGRQAYVVFPLIEESEKVDLNHLMDGYEALSRDFPLPQYAIGIVHGRLKPQIKDFEMSRFVKGETNILVSTTVIEVGVDVPNASIMVIENAERFGLSQLHQLRGRVGRGADQSWCILMAGEKVTNEGKARLQAMVESNDGFRIAETDLKLRGPGDLEGTRQSGILELRIADLIQDEPILKLAREYAMRILEKDPDLIAEQNRVLREQLRKMMNQNQDWSRIS
jgi:ATP-dependent DNA helicase RecG